MGSILPRNTSGPRTYEAVANIIGGRVVEARAGGTSNPGVGHAVDGSLKVIGVAQKDATADGGADRAPSAGVLDVTMSPAEVAVFSSEHVPVEFSVACAYGAAVAAAADGKVRPWLVASDPADAIIGKCVEGGGVAEDAVGLVRLH